MPYWVISFCFAGVLFTHFFVRPCLQWLLEKVWSLQIKLIIVYFFCNIVGLVHWCAVAIPFYFLFGMAPSDIPLAAYFGVMCISITEIMMWSGAYCGYITWRKQRQEETRLLELEVALRDTQLDGLKQQLNPHFIFNSLNSIRSMVVEDRDIARDMITRLSNLLRYSLYLSQQNTVPLSDEIAIVRDYLSIEKQRYENRLNITWSIDPSIEKTPIIPLSLQTLVENAIKHNINNYENGIDINIEAYPRDDKVILSVKNRGKLLSTEGSGLGLKNTQQRLALVFGTNASLSLTEDKDEEVSATLTIPALV